MSGKYVASLLYALYDTVLYSSIPISVHARYVLRHVRNCRSGVVVEEFGAGFPADFQISKIQP